jgi:hypothetical protein
MKKLIGIILTTMLAISLASSETTAQLQRIADSHLPPQYFTCFKLLELQTLPYDSTAGTVAGSTGQLTNYYRTLGWLEGFFTARNMFDTTTDGHLTKGTKTAIGWSGSSAIVEPTLTTETLLRRS